MPARFRGFKRESLVRGILSPTLSPRSAGGEREKPGGSIKHPHYKARLFFNLAGGAGKGRRTACIASMELMTKNMVR
jgi:hypothetical protein